MQLYFELFKLICFYRVEVELSIYNLTIYLLTVGTKYLNANLYTLNTCKFNNNGCKYIFSLTVNCITGLCLPLIYIKT